jgi:hypothetical protein
MMLHSLSAFPDLIDKLPAPESVRERLSWALREAKVLRQLLKVVEHAAKDREYQNARKGATACR